MSVVPFSNYLLNLLNNLLILQKARVGIGMTKTKVRESSMLVIRNLFNVALTRVAEMLNNNTNLELP